MSVYRGEVTSNAASGPITISLPIDPVVGWVSGNLKIGALPKLALTGFSGRMLQDGAFEASGANRRGRGIEDTMYLEVKVTGQRSADGQHVTGTIAALINGIPQEPWAFHGAVRGAAEMVASLDPGGELVLTEPEPTMLEKIPTSVKVAAGVGAALGAAYFYKRK